MTFFFACLTIILLPMSPWISAFRPRTLPLALASILTGGFLAKAAGHFNGPVVALAALTTILLQVLSNLANDYGDSQNGADSVHRQGPQRAVQSGAITPAQMKRGMWICGLLALASGLALLWVALGAAGLGLFLAFLALGLAAIWAAVNYTAGSNPYGYAGPGRHFGVPVFRHGGRVRHLFPANPQRCRCRCCCPPPRWAASPRRC